jgi:hypothetical protein
MEKCKENKKEIVKSYLRHFGVAEPVPEKTAGRQGWLAPAAPVNWREWFRVW